MTSLPGTQKGNFYCGYVIGTKMWVVKGLFRANKRAKFAQPYLSGSKKSRQNNLDAFLQLNKKKLNCHSLVFL